MSLFDGVDARYGVGVVVADVGWKSVSQFQCFILNEL